MDNEDKLSLQKLSIYLIKDQYKDPQSIIDLEKRPERRALDGIGDLFVRKGWPKPPRWAPFFEDYVNEEELGLIESTAAALIIESKQRLFAVTFGQGRYLLNPGCWEERFGLLACLNSIGESNIRSIDKVTIDTISRHSKEQASREVHPSEFGLDIEQDLLRGVTGRPTEEGLGTRISGTDALHVLAHIKIGSLRELLSKYYGKSLEDTYKNIFPWVDHIREIKDVSIIEQLDSVLIEKMINEELDNIWMAVPQVVEWERIKSFQFIGFGRQLSEYSDIHIPEFLKLIKDRKELSKELLIKRRANAIDHDGKSIYKWQVYHCLHAEIDIDSESFLLSGGKWYRIDRDFVSEVNEAYKKIPRYQHCFMEYDHESEAAYNKYVAESDSSKYALMDRKLIQYGGANQKIEFCDLLINKKDIVHIKRYGQSSALSHLFSQGLISGDLFFTDAEFRKLVNERLPKEHRLEDYNRRIEREEFQIVFAVISNNPGDDLVLPFFSRLNCKHAAKRLQEVYGYRVSIGKISINQIRTRTQTCPPKLKGFK
ncbi:MAG: DUF6119 family protein [Desulfobaccales bacterium]